MEAKRFFVTPADIEQDVIKIKGEEFKHLSKVLRYKLGYELIVCDNTGYDYYAKLIALEKDCAYAQILKKTLNRNETVREIILCQAVCKEIDFIVQKAVELGVSKLLPFTSQFTNVTEINPARLQRLAINASKQCGGAKIMQILPLVDFASMLEYTKEGDCIFFYEESQEKLAIENSSKAPLFIVIGSEGGFSKEEIALAHSKAIRTFSLGKRVLRAETAAVCGLVLALDKIGELD